MAQKPRSLDDINSLYDTDISAARAIEKGKSRLKNDTPQPAVYMPETEAGETIGAPVEDISSIVNDIIRSIDAPTNAKPGRINVPQTGMPAQKPGYRPDVRMPRTGVQELVSQQQRKRSYPAASGGPSYQRQKATVQERQRSEVEEAKRRKNDEYRQMLTGEGSSRRSREEMDEFASEYASIMDDSDESRRARRARRKEEEARQKQSAAEHENINTIPEPQPDEDGFQKLFHEATDDIPTEQRNQGYILSQTQSDFGGMFDGTDMATLPYSAKQFIYEQKVMYEQQARELQAEYDRKRESEFARAQAEQELLRAEQARIREEAALMQLQWQQNFEEREKAYQAAKEEEARRYAEQAQAASRQIDLLKDERDRLIDAQNHAAEEQFSRQQEHDRLLQELESSREYSQQGQSRIAELESLLSQSEAERDQLEQMAAVNAAELDAMQLQQDQAMQMVAEAERQIATAQKEMADAWQEARLARRDADEARAIADEMTLQAANAARDLEAEQNDENEIPDFTENEADADEASAFDAVIEAEAFAEEVLTKREKRKAEKQRAKEEAAINREAERQMVEEAKQRAKAEKAARKAAKKVKNEDLAEFDEIAAIAELPAEESIVQDDIIDETSDSINEQAVPGEQFEYIDELSNAHEYTDEYPEPQQVEPKTETAALIENEDYADEEPKKHHDGARKFFRFIFALCLIVSLLATALAACVGPVLKVNTAEPVAFAPYYVFTAPQSVDGTQIATGDLIIVRRSDSAATGEVLSYVSTDGTSYGFATKSGVSIDSSGETFYSFTQGDGIRRSNVLGVIELTVPKLGFAIEPVVRYYIIAVAALAVLSAVLLIIVAYVLRNKNKHKADEEAESETEADVEVVYETVEDEFSDESLSKKELKAAAKQAKRDERAAKKAAKLTAKEQAEVEIIETTFDGVAVPDDEAFEAEIVQNKTEDANENIPFENDLQSDDVSLDAEEQSAIGGAAFSFEVESKPAENEDVIPEFLRNAPQAIDSDSLFDAFRDIISTSAEQPDPQLQVEPDEDVDSYMTIDEIAAFGAQATEPIQSLENDDGMAFEDVSSNDDELFDDNVESVPYSQGDETFFGDNGGVFGDFEDFDDEFDAPRRRKHLSRSERRRNKEKGASTQGSDDADVFGSL